MTDSVQIDSTVYSSKLALTVAAAIWEKKGFDVVALRVKEIVQYTDFMVIASARNERQAMAIADNVEDEVRTQLGQKPIGEEGRRAGRWVLVDFGDIVVHIFHKPVRAYYELERLFADAPRLPLEEPAWVHEIGPDDAEGAEPYTDLVWQGVKWRPGDAQALIDDPDAAAEDEAELEDEEALELAALAADDEKEELTEIE
jgi:ribosome-associated protein